MDFRHIQAFVAAAATANFTRAGEHLGRTQSAISQQIRLLEDEVGQALFIRMRHRVTLTRAGESLLPVAREILKCRDIMQGKGKGKAGIGELTGPLSVGTIAAGIVYLWASVCQSFASRHPGIEVAIRATERTQDTIDRVVSGDLDVGFAPLPTTTRVESHVLGTQEAVLVTATSHELGTRRAVRPRDMANERFILYEPQISMRWLTDQWFEAAGIAPKVVLESNDTDFIRALVEVGFGIAFLPNWAVARAVADRRLRVVPISGLPLKQEFGVIFRKHGLSLAARAFVDYCNANRNLLPPVTQATGATTLKKEGARNRSRK